MSQSTSSHGSGVQSLSPDYFEAMYAANIDPWNFETSEYEANKYADTVATLPREKYRSGLEIGGSIGVLTEKLAKRCELLLSIDVSAQAQERAKERCRHLPQVEFEVMQVPLQYPNRTFDLTLVSEVGYYWDSKDIKTAQQQIAAQLAPGGHLLLVHWTPYVAEYPLTGDEVHDAFLAQGENTYRSLVSRREDRYRLDLLERL